MSQTLQSAPADHAWLYWRDQVVLPGVKALDEGDVSDEQFRALAAYLPTLCWLARGDGYIIWYNERWHDYCGTTPEQMEGWGWQSVHDPEQLAGVLQAWQRSIALGEPFEMVFPLRGADGSFRPFLTRVVPARNETGDVVRWFGVNTEIGDQVRAEDALRLSEAKFEALTDAMPQMVWSALPNGEHDYFNAQWYAFTGVPVGSTDGAGWADMFHPDDRQQANEKWAHSLESGELYEVEYRLRHHTGSYRWTLGRAQPLRDAGGRISRWIGTCTDIDEAKRAAEETELLGRELSHRIKNIFAVIGGIVSLTGRRSVELRPIVKELLDRISALGRAHNFARPHSPESQPGELAGTLHGLIVALLEPYTNDQLERVRLSGDDIPVDDRGATPLSLALHELATNSAKYGALSSETGKLDLCVTQDGAQVRLVWREIGGPQIESTPERVGFGTELADIAIERQLGGSIQRDWMVDGLQVTIEFETANVWRG
jgi:PAS domain S-box-containing protein